MAVIVDKDGVEITGLANNTLRLSLVLAAFEGIAGMNQDRLIPRSASSTERAQHHLAAA